VECSEQVYSLSTALSSQFMLSATSVPTVDTQYPTEAESFPPRNELLYYVQLIKCAVLSIATLKC